MDHEQLINMWKEDCSINSLKLEEELYRTPLLHSKYLEILQSLKTRERSLFHKAAMMRELKTKYFNGKMGKDELDSLGWSQYQYNAPTKGALERMLEADPDLHMLMEKVEYNKIMISTAESIMKEISARSFHIRAAIDMRKLEAGL